MWFIDQILYREKVWARTVAQNRFKHEGVEYAKAEIAKSRLLSKNVNGAVLLTPLLHKMYPDATFFGLVRDGRALCESHLRRGASVEEVVDLYREIGGAMLNYESAYSSFHLLRFEDLISRPRNVLSMLYEAVNLRLDRLRKIRLQVKEKTSASGDRHLKSDQDREVVWYELSKFDSYFGPNVNDNQISQLNNSDRDYFESHSGDMLKELGYDVDESPD